MPMPKPGDFGSIERVHDLMRKVEAFREGLNEHVVCIPDAMEVNMEGDAQARMESMYHETNDILHVMQDLYHNYREYVFHRYGQHKVLR